jgi:pimeloyl-ACP methyl ester carboxylesterase
MSLATCGANRVGNHRIIDDKADAVDGCNRLPVTTGFSAGSLKRGGEMTTSATSKPATPGVDNDAAEKRRIVSEEATSILRDDFDHDLGVSYGPHPRQVFDCYYPVNATDAPVMVFLHGGGFRLGSPGPVAYYGRPILEAGGVFVSLGYRLAPEIRFPDTTEDAELGLAAIGDSVRARGANSDSMYLSGHSAGASLAAMAALRPQTPATKGIAGLVLVSGMYNDSVRSPEIENFDSPRYVPDLTQALEHIPSKTIVIAGDHDLPTVLPAALAIIDAIQAADGSVEFFVEDDADHFEAIRGFATAGTPTANAVLQMMGLA